MRLFLFALTVLLSLTALPATATLYEFQNTSLFTFRSIETDVTAKDAKISGWIELAGTYGADPVNWNFTVSVVGGDTFRFKRPAQTDQFNYGISRKSVDGDSLYDFTTGHVLHTNLKLEVDPSSAVKPQVLQLATGFPSGTSVFNEASPQAWFANGGFLRPTRDIDEHHFPVPEPSTGVLLVAGAVFVGWRMRTARVLEPQRRLSDAWGAD